MFGLIVAVFFFLPLLCFGTSFAASAQLLLSALLVVASLFLFKTQRDKDDPDLVIVGNPERHIGKGYKHGKDVHRVEFTFRVCHTAPTFAALWKVHIKNSEVSNVSWKMKQWEIEKIDIGQGVRIPSQTYLPALVKPNEITSVTFGATVDVETRDKAAKLPELKWCFEYHIGNYKKKTKRYERNVITKKQ